MVFIVMVSSAKILVQCAVKASRWVLGREGGQTVGGRVQLLFEECGEVNFCHIPQQDTACQRDSS